MSDTTEVAGSIPVENSSNEASPADTHVEAGADAIASSTKTPEKRRFKVKIDDREDEVDEDEVVKGYQRAKASDARFQKASELMKKVEQERRDISEFLKNPWKHLETKGVNAREMAEQFLTEQLEWEGLPESDRKRIIAERERDALKERIDAAEKEKIEGRRKSLEAQAVKEIDQEIGEALKTLGRKPTPRLIARITEQMIAGYERELSSLQAEYGTEDLPADVLASVKGVPASQAVGRVHQEYLEDIGEFLVSLPPKELLDALPKSVLDVIRQHGVKEILAQDPVGSRKPPAERTEPQRRGGPKRMSTDSLFSNIQKKYGS